MLPPDFLTLNRISLDNPAASKKRVLEEAAHLLAAGHSSPVPEQIFEKLLERERLGSTGLSKGIALPHARLSGVSMARGAFIRLQNPVDFDAPDAQPVDLLFALLVPENATEEHLNLLATLARSLSDEVFCRQLRQLDEPAIILSTLTGRPSDDAPGSHGSGSIHLTA